MSNRFGGVSPKERQPHSPFLFTQREEGLFPETDPDFKQLALSDEKDESVVRVASYHGFIVKQRSPYQHWIVFSAVDGSELPISLQGHFTNAQSVREAIDTHLALKEQVTA